MLLVRFVSEPQKWKKALIARDSGTKTLPLIALHAFTPTPREGNEISLYRLDDEVTVATLAAAYWLKAKGQFALLGVSQDMILEAGGILDEDQPGDTFHPVVNGKHVNLKVETAEAAFHMSELFFNHGKLLPFEQSEIKSSIANDNASDLIDFRSLAKAKNIHQLNKLGDLISEETLKVSTP